MRWLRRREVCGVITLFERMRLHCVRLAGEREEESMSSEEIAVALDGLRHETGSLKHRMDGVERNGEVLRELAASVKVMAAELRGQGETMKEIKKDVTALGSKVDVIEGKPGRRWESLTEKALWAVCAAVIAFLCGRVGL